MSIQLKGNDNSSFSDDVVIGGGKITLSGADGSATFEETVDIGNATTSLSNTGVVLYSGGGIGIRNDTVTSAFQIYKDGNANSDRTVVLSTDGSATFNGGVDSYAPIRIARDDGSNLAFQVNAGTFASSASISFSAGGQATFNYSSPGVDVLKVQQAGANQFRVTSNGSIFAIDTTVQPQTSERRLKENIVPLDASTAWETIKSTPYYTYNFIGDDATRYGPMADEVPTEMVVQPMEENEAGVMVARSDDEGPIRTFDNGMLQARLYTALQTALTRIETLEARLTTLEGDES